MACLTGARVLLALPLRCTCVLALVTGLLTPAASATAGRAPSPQTGSYSGAAQLLATPGGTVWAVNNSSPAGESIFRSTDNGATWVSKLTVALPSTGCCGLVASYFLGAEHGWAVDEVLHGDGVGETTTVYGTSDGGAHWRRSKGLAGDLTTNAGVPLFDQLYFATPEDGWLLGVGDDLVPAAPAHLVLLLWRTTDGGQTWQPMPNAGLPMQAETLGPTPSEAPCPSSSPPHITFVNEETGFLSEGACGHGRAAPAVWRTADGGKSWASVHLPAPAGGWGNWYVDGRGGTDIGQVLARPVGGGTVLLAPVATGTSGLAVERSSNLGLTWSVASQLDLPALSEDGDAANWFDPLSAGAWVEALPSAVMRTADGGRHWQLVRSSLALAYPGAPVVSFTSLNNGFVLGDNLTVAASTNDGGHNWTAAEVPGAVYRKLVAGEGQPVGYVDGVAPGLEMASGASGLWVSANGGSAWSERLGPAMPVTQVDVVGPSLSFALAGGEILRTDDNGLHWQHLLQPSAGPALAIDFWSAEAGVAAVGGADYVSGTGYYLTTDGGLHWEQLGLPRGWDFASGLVAQDGAGSLCSGGDGAVWAAGARSTTAKVAGEQSRTTSQAQLFVSSDEGRHWRTVLPASDLPAPDWAASGQASPAPGTGLEVGACRGDAAWVMSSQAAGPGNMQGPPLTFDMLYTDDLGASWQDVLRSSSYLKVPRPDVASAAGGPVQAGPGFAGLLPRAFSAAPGGGLAGLWLTTYNEDLGGVAFANTADAGLSWSQDYFPGGAKAALSPLPTQGWLATSAANGADALSLFTASMGKQGHPGRASLYVTTDEGQRWALSHVFVWPQSMGAGLPGRSAEGTLAGAAPLPATAGKAVVLLGDGVGAARFGQSDEVAAADLDRALSPAKARPVDLAGNCTVDRALQWPVLTAYFDRDRFVGYSTLAANGEKLAEADVATAKGLRTGDTLAEARRLYGAALTTSAAQGGAWFAKTPDGRLEGYLSAEVNRDGPQPRIASIEAGQVGCPAATP